MGLCGRTAKARCWPCQLKAAPFGGPRARGWRKKACARSTAAYQVPGDALVCSSRETTSGTAAASDSPPGRDLTIVRCHSPWSTCLRVGHIGELNGNHHSSIFQVSGGGLVSAAPQKQSTAFGLPFVYVETVLMASTWPCQP